MIDWFMWMDEFTLLITEKFENMFYKKTIILWTLDI